MSVLFETVMPYLKERLLLYLNENKETINQRLSKVVKALIFLGDLTVFGYKFRYLVDQDFGHFKPYLELFGITIRRPN